MAKRMRIFILARHGESRLNVAGVVNADPARDQGLTPRGEQQARDLGAQIAAIRVELVVTSRFPRAQETARAALEGRDVPHAVVSELDDVRIGNLEGKTIADYRAWKSRHPRSHPFPGGESLDDAALRFAGAFSAILDRPEQVIFVACHEIPVRYAVNAASGSAMLDSPLHDVRNAQLYLFDEHGLAAAVAGIERLAASG
jgi:broad specificity phosphatase PhoE